MNATQTCDLRGEAAEFAPRVMIGTGPERRRALWESATLSLAALLIVGAHALMGLLPAGVLSLVLGVAFYFIRLTGLLPTAAADATAQGLRAEREHFNAVMEGAAVGTWDLDVRSGLIVVNARWAETIGRRREELTRLNLEDRRALVHPEDRPAYEAALTSAMEDPGGVAAAEFRVRHAERRWVW